MRTAAFTLLGYLSGSVLYARVYARVFRRERMIEESKDKNPGTANAFMYGGFWCGCMTLFCDLLKGFLPVFLYLQDLAENPADSYGILTGSYGLSLVLAAPVIGHAFPVFYKRKGGKGIAVTFGCLLGLYPMWQPVGALIVFFLFFSGIVRITPHFKRTLVVYFFTLCSLVYVVREPSVFIGFAMITVVVYIRMYLSVEEKERMRVKLLWMH